MQRHVLVLTSWYFPYQVIPWQAAITQLYLGKAERLADYAEEVRSPSITMKMPAVVRLRRDLGKRKRGIKFSRFNVYTRDDFRCQYCGERKPMRELTFDHVVPRAHGGSTTWDNIVTACKPCNSAKGRRSCDEAGMFPRREPVRPKTLPLHSPVGDPDRAPTEWLPFLPVTS
jgi:5-methylcytosine-specific restriction endonuclease McrA